MIKIRPYGSALSRYMHNMRQHCKRFGSSDINQHIIRLIIFQWYAENSNICGTLKTTQPHILYMNWLTPFAVNYKLHKGKKMVFNLHEIRRYSLGMKHHLLILYIYEYITLLMQVYNESNMVVLSSIYKYCMLYFFLTVYMTVRMLKTTVLELCILCTL